MADNQLNTTKFNQLKYTRLVIKQLKTFNFSHALIAEIGLAALYHLSKDVSSRREIIESGGVEIVKSFPVNMGNRNDCLISLVLSSDMI